MPNKTYFHETWLSDSGFFLFQKKLKVNFVNKQFFKKQAIKKSEPEGMNAGNRLHLEPLQSQPVPLVFPDVMTAMFHKAN